MATLSTQRTYAIVGTAGSGKTSTAEMLLFQAGAISRLGKSEEGATVMDYEPEEQKRHGSVQPGLAHYTWQKADHFVIDAPGDNNFLGDLPYLLQAVDGVVFVIDAVDGVRPLTKRIWSEVKKAGLPAVVFINKMDRDRAEFQPAYDGLSAMLGIRPVLLYAPIGSKAEFSGLVDVLGGAALTFGDDGKTSPASIPADMAEDMEALRETTIENVAESDEELMELYLEEGELTPEQVAGGLKKGVASGELAPVLAGAALENKGGVQLLEAVAAYLPAPTERPAWIGRGKGGEPEERESAPEAPAAAYVFKTLADPFAGRLSLVRVVSGQVGPDMSLTNQTTGEAERLGQPLFLMGKEQKQVKEPQGPGALLALAKLKNTHTADTLADPKAPFAVEKAVLPPALITYALKPKQKGDEDKVYAAVHKLLEEDVNLALSRDEETADILLSGMGQMHIETSVEKARRRYKVEIELAPPKIPYRETIKGSAQVQGRHKKQSGGRGQFGDCHIKMEPRQRGEGYEFVDAIVGGVIPRQFIPAVDKGVQEAAQRGFLAGYPVVDFKVTLFDGSYHTVDSSEMAFKMAGSIAFKKAMEACKPVLLEPIVLVTVTIPDEHMGDVIGDLSSRRGKVLGSDAQAGVTEIKAHVPMSEVLKYAPDLRSMTGGQGTFLMEFDHYEEAPPPVAEKVIAERQAASE